MVLPCQKVFPHNLADGQRRSRTVVCITDVLSVVQWVPRSFVIFCYQRGEAAQWTCCLPALVMSVANGMLCDARSRELPSAWATHVGNDG